MYALIENNTVKRYPYSLSELRADNPNTSFPEKISDEVMQAFGVVRVQQVDSPDHNHRTQDCQKLDPVFENGVWKEAWKVTEASDAEKEGRKESQANAVRALRNQKLRETDWTQLADTTGPTKAAYVQYRQALRDIPSQSGFPWSVTWPDMP